jgi:ACS family glucarate transporter-like MFS transporter
MKTMGWFSAAPLLGIALGVLLGGMLSDFLPSRFGKRNGRRIPGLIGLPLAAATVTVAITTSNPVLSALLLAFAAFLAALGVAPAWTICVDIGGPHAGIVSGTMNMFGNLGGALVSLVVGFCLKYLRSYDAAMYSIALFYLGAAACWLFVDPGQVLTAPFVHASDRASGARR